VGIAHDIMVLVDQEKERSDRLMAKLRELNIDPHTIEQ
jgi:hypothetical protein